MNWVLNLDSILHCYPSAVWPDLAKFRHFGKNLMVFGDIFDRWLVFDKTFKPYFGNFYNRY